MVPSPTALPSRMLQADNLLALTQEPIDEVRERITYFVRAPCSPALLVPLAILSRLNCIAKKKKDGAGRHYVSHSEAGCKQTIHSKASKTKSGTKEAYPRRARAPAQ